MLFINLLAGLESVCVALLPYLTSDFIEQIGSLTGDIVIRFAVWYVMAIIGILFFEYITKVAADKLMAKMMYQMKSDVVRKIVTMPQDKFHLQDTNYYITVITEDIRNLYMDYFYCVFDFLNSIIRVIVYSVFMFYLNPVLALVILVCSIISMFIPEVAGGKLSRLRNEQSEENASYLGILKELFGGFSLINALTRKAFMKRHNDACEKRESITYKYNKFRAFVEIFAAASLYFINIAAFICGIMMIQHGKLTAGSFVGLISFIDLVAMPVKDIMYQFIGIKSAGELKKKIEELLNQEEVTKKVNNIFTSEISFRNVSFSQGDFTLQNVDLTLKKGKKYAIIGKSGAGKSTLLKLLFGRYSDYTGDILIDGVDSRELELSGLIADIGQDAILFAASAKENITVFDSYPANNLPFYVTALNAEGLLRENFGEAGAKISGGEKNKIALLRALNQECEVLLCDEMFSALDEHNKKQISDYLFSREDLTILSITHDVSEQALLYYDEIILMEQGRVLKMGEAKKMLPFIENYMKNAY